MAVKRPPYRPNSLVPDIVPPKDSPLEELNAQCEVGLRFYNGMTYPVTVIFRSGVELVIPPVMGQRGNCFYVRNVHRLNRDVIVDTRRLLDDNRKYVNHVAERYDVAFRREPTQKGIGSPFMNHRNVDFELTRQLFDQNGGVVYLENLDIIVSILNPSYTPRHPFSIGAYADALLESDPVLQDLSSFHYRITIVDSARRFGSRFININGTVYNVPTIDDSQIRDGVYVIRTTPSHGALQQQLPESTCYDFEVAEKELGLWKSYTEALTLGDPASAMKRAFEQATHDVKLEGLEATRSAQELKARYEQEKREQDAELATIKHNMAVREARLAEREHEMRTAEGELKHRLEILRREQEILQNHYERGAMVRKERIEWLKVTPIVIGAIGTIVAAVKAIKSAKQ